MRRLLLLALCCLPWQASPREPDPAGDTPPQDVTEMDAVRVTAVRPPVDPFAFDNPVQVEGTVFSRAWDEPPSLEEIGLRGGIVQIAINKGLEKAGAAIRRLPGWKLQVRDAIARPPPLDHEQAARAARFLADESAPR